MGFSVQDEEAADIDIGLRCQRGSCVESKVGFLTHKGKALVLVMLA